jgi:hypothetical protein
MDIIEMFGKELDAFSKQAAQLYEAGFVLGLTGLDPRNHSSDVDPVDRFYSLGIEHGAAWRKLRADLGL